MVEISYAVVEISLQSLLSWSLASLFCLLGLLNLAAPENFLSKYFHWNYPRCDRRVSGVMEICAAALIAFEATFFWGMVLAALVLFGGVVLLLCASKYIYALTGAVLLAALGASLLMLQAGVA